jgi:hypothetical protein
MVQLEVEIRMLAQVLMGWFSQSQAFVHMMWLWKLQRQQCAAALQLSSGGIFPVPQFAVAAAFVPKQDICQQQLHTDTVKAS